MPRLSIGTSAVHATVLLAASGAAIPFGRALAELLLFGDQRRASLYARNAEIVPPPPGMMPFERAHRPSRSAAAARSAATSPAAETGSAPRCSMLSPILAHRSGPAARQPQTGPP